MSGADQPMDEAYVAALQAAMRAEAELRRRAAAAQVARAAEAGDPPPASPDDPPLGWGDA